MGEQAKWLGRFRSLDLAIRHLVSGSPPLRHPRRAIICEKIVFDTDYPTALESSDTTREDEKLPGRTGVEAHHPMVGLRARGGLVDGDHPIRFHSGLQGSILRGIDEDQMWFRSAGYPDESLETHGFHHRGSHERDGKDLGEYFPAEISRGASMRRPARSRHGPAFCFSENRAGSNMLRP